MVLFVPLLGAAAALSCVGVIHAVRALCRNCQAGKAALRGKALAGLSLSVAGLLLALVLGESFVSSLGRARDAADRATEYRRAQDRSMEPFPHK